MQNSQKKQDIELLKKFKEAVRIWRNTSSENYRSEINTMLPRIKQILTLTKSNRYVTLNAPLMMGDQRILNNANALDLLFDCPFDMDVNSYLLLLTSDIINRSNLGAS